jgi:nicotinamidase-related amidase
LEYEALHGREDDYATCFEIVDEIGNYKYASFIIKEQDDGSYEASEEFLKYIPSRQVKKIEVCGVNICACVRQTAEGLARIFPQAKVVVVKKACNDLYYGKDNGFDEYRKDMRNLVLV